VLKSVLLVFVSPPSCVPNCGVEVGRGESVCVKIAARARNIKTSFVYVQVSCVANVLLLNAFSLSLFFRTKTCFFADTVWAQPETRNATRQTSPPPDKRQKQSDRSPTFSDKIRQKIRRAADIFRHFSGQLRPSDIIFFLQWIMWLTYSASCDNGGGAARGVRHANCRSAVPFVCGFSGIDAPQLQAPCGVTGGQWRQRPSRRAIFIPSGRQTQCGVGALPRSMGRTACRHTSSTPGLESVLCTGAGNVLCLPPVVAGAIHLRSQKLDLSQLRGLSFG
jgi:hypothetical protein